MNDNTPQFGQGDTSYKAANGYEGLYKLCEDFYAFMDQLPEAQVIRKMHPQDISISIEKLALFLCGWLGGPRKFQEKYGSIHIPQFHKRFPIGPNEEMAWITCMDKAIDQQEDYSQEFKDYLKVQLRVPAHRVRVVSEDYHGKS